MSAIKEFEHLRIPLKAIKLATNNFDDNNYISRGGFGKVYKGELIHLGKSMTVAVKCLDRAFGQGNPEFWKEIMMLSRYKHQNLVSLLGFCYEDGESILVYEYLPNKSLNMHLSSNDLSWTQRLKICIGAAKGLRYLHDPGRTMQRVLHRDIKSSNILLDDNWNAKISDFGLANFGPANQEFTFLFTHPVGSFGYCDPAYVESGFLTKESDVYSFGVVLFEVLCGRLCIVDYNDNRRFLSKLAQSCYEENRLDTIVQDGLLEQMSRECLRKFSTIAYQCLHKDRTQRPTFTKIVRELEIALQFQNQDQSTFQRNDDFAPITPSASKDEYLKDTLAAYRSAAADAAARMQAASRARSFKRRKKDVESSNTEEEARSIIAAMRIQNCFRTWKTRKDFLNKRHQIIKIQTIFRGHQVRREYTKIVWSVGVLGKAIVRWRSKRRGHQGLQVDPNNVEKDENQENNGMEEPAGEHVEKSVVRSDSGLADQVEKEPA
ncbi:hypothetical protein OSB04_014030 [Centaurea solstitialis]|uniref:non-specific serine/threonine protein kinase n=1 Tax=Centaurea solstitialis TaxID=347529 RepID=A0AA38WRL0_9ASTR|nr:hypothetical protein OSB04_014030 [Centaurea solstitialis]